MYSLEPVQFPAPSLVFAYTQVLHLFLFLSARTVYNY